MSFHHAPLTKHLPASLLGLVLTACGVTATQPVSTNKKRDAGPVGAAVLAAASVPAPAAATPPAAPPLPSGDGLVTAQFLVNATALGVSMCQGTITLKVNIALGTKPTAQMFEIPEGLLSCSALGSIDLHALLSGVATQAGAPGNQTSLADNVVGIVTDKGYTYNPPRPMIPSFISSSPQALAQLNVSRQVTMTGPGTTTSGLVTLKTNSYNQPFLAPQIKTTFPSVIDYTTTVTGFSGVDKVANTLFDSMQVRISTNPIAVVSLAMTTTLGDISQGIVTNQGSATGILQSVSPLATSTKPLFGFIPNFIGPLVKNVQLNISMDLVSQQGLDPAKIAVQSTGEKLGGVATGG